MGDRHGHGPGPAPQPWRCRCRCSPNLVGGLCARSSPAAAPVAPSFSWPPLADHPPEIEARNARGESVQLLAAKAMDKQDVQVGRAAGVWVGAVPSRVLPSRVPAGQG